jgi:antitoxin (DNA-binding transcriptional repressor) of toxin-antitoxin stability system
MTKLNIHEAKTHLSKYLQHVLEGETILLCKNDVPIAQITPLPHLPASKKRRIGLAKGMGKVERSFFEALTDEELPGFGL